MPKTDPVLGTLSQRISHALQTIRGIYVKLSLGCQEEIQDAEEASFDNFVTVLDNFIHTLKVQHKEREAEALLRAKDISLESRSHGGLDIELWKPLELSSCDAIVFWVEAWLQSLSAAEKSRLLPYPRPERPSQRRGMTLTEKIFAHHSIGPISPAGLRAGDFVRVVVDWVAASEISYFSISKTLWQLKSFKTWRNDRVWIAGDHVVDLRTYNTPWNRRLIHATEKAARDFKLTDYKEPNVSNTCSSGAVGCLTVGLGAADVAMSAITGETWFKVSECIHIRFFGVPHLGIGGKDIILHILGELKRNTVAAERIVEFSGPGYRNSAQSPGFFVPDDIVKTYVSGRKQKHRRSSSICFQPDPDAVYAETCEIDLATVKPLFAIYPSPDNVVPVPEKAGTYLDGCFIGAYTTTEEDLILAALVLDVGLKWNLSLAPGKRHLTPGSIPIRLRLEALGLLDLYQSAGFSLSAPGCSFCVGMGADQAGEGEVWLSSQNRNFKNRMGKGSIGNLSSAATVAASSFGMTVTDPAPFLAEIDVGFFNALKNRPGKSKFLQNSVQMEDIFYVEPSYEFSSKPTVESGSLPSEKNWDSPIETVSMRPPIGDRVIRLGDFVDTDAIAPADSLVTATTDEALGDHCMKYVMPEFRDKVRQGQKVLVAGKALGVGSSRETANAGDSAEIEISLDERQVRVAGLSFSFQLADMELALIENQGMPNAYEKFGSDIFQSLSSGGTVSTSESASKPLNGDTDIPATLRELQW
ncbi:aconitase family protein [Penicillium alfredii]|uniref:Aconitase family protein n=1 Tax=Penicillium alfredii TaxID=1506179 RepID=A0A9W9EGQ2_9EURO|nr:aconitase family protein [Penicillium alfredii]KAJ5081503.1 aconitase family protein [Penicillium alfredii]